MEKKPQNTAGDRNEDPALQGFSSAATWNGLSAMQRTTGL